MKSVATQLSTAIRQAYSITAVPRLTVDWNFNRYFSPTADNTPAEATNAFDAESFPIESIIDGFRPTKGAMKARVGAGVVADDYNLSDSRFYIGGPDDVYKYYTSQQPTNSSGVFPTHTDGLSIARPQVTYSKVTQSNKIVIKLENTWASPLSYNVKIQTTLNGGWTTISTNPTIQSDGQIILYYNGTSWSVTKPATLVNTAVAGVQLLVTSMTSGRKKDGTIQTFDTYASAPTYAPVYDNNGVVTNPVNYSNAGAYTTQNTTGANSHLDVIAIEAHQEADFSSRLVNVTDSFDISDVSYLYPIGTLTTQIGTVELSNEDGVFNQSNSSSPYYGLIEPNAQFTLEWVYTISGVNYSVQEFSLYGAEWGGTQTDTVTIELTDAGKFLQTMISESALWENLTVPQIITRVLDSVGFTNYNTNITTQTTNFRIPVFWTDGEKSAWDVLDELAKASQTAIYFDAYGVLQVKTREVAFNNTAAPVWTLRGVASGLELPDIVTLDQTDQFETNDVTVSYQTTKWAEANNGQPTMQKVWEPDGTVTLRASQLTTAMSATDTLLWINLDDIAVWPYSAQLNVDNEIMEYEGKQYVYYTGTSGTVRNVAIVKSDDEKTQTNLLTPSDYVYKNHFTGALNITSRGLWNTVAAIHLVDATGYSVRRIVNGTKTSGVTGMSKHIKDESVIQLTAGPRFNDTADVLVSTRGSGVDSAMKIYGTSIRLDKGSYKHMAGGLVINSQANSGEDGYYIELMASTKIDAKVRKVRNELVVWTRVNGKRKALNGKGHVLAVAPGQWYDIDVYCASSGGNDILKIYVNGVYITRVTISGSDKVTLNGRFGMFIAGSTQASFEYLYGNNSTDLPEPPDDVSWFDMIYSGYRGAMWDREWSYRWSTRTRRIKKKSVKESYRYDNWVFDDFGPWVHEIRTYDVKFDPNPILQSRLFMTNDWNAIAMEYRSNPFGAHWVVANCARKNAVLNGDDSLTFDESGSGTIAQALCVFGRALVVSEAETIEVKDSAAIQKRGKIDTELSSDWIQNKDMAQALADWIVAHWSPTSAELTVTVFGNPLIELTDIVAVDYPRKNMTAATHKYYVTGIESGFDNGVTTTLTLRRVV